MPKLVNRAKMTTATTGTGTITLGSAVAGYQTFANAGVANGNIVRYTIEDGSAWEIGLGTYSSTGTTLTRGTIESSTGTAINLSGNATVFVTTAAGDLQELVTFAETFALPTADGTNGQVLTTNGTGTLTFSTISGGATDINGLSDGYAQGSSVGLGLRALDSDDGTNNENTALGVDALTGFTSGVISTGQNTAVGYLAMSSSTGGYQNTSVGAYSLQNMGGVGNNTALGYEAGFGVTTGGSGVFVGSSAGRNVTTATRPIAVGRDALFGNATSKLTGTDNVGVGYQAGYGLTTGANNFLGAYHAGYALTTGSNNVAIGNGALDAATTGGVNIAIGQDAMGSGIATVTSGNNIALGYRAGYTLDSGVSNVAIGDRASTSMTYGGSNVTIGPTSGQYLNGSRSVALGSTALRGDPTLQATGDDNIGIGTQTGQSLTTGATNFFAGYQSGRLVTTGSNNVFAGNLAGDATTTGSNQIVIGYNADASSATVSHEITLGNASITTLRCQVTTITSLSDARDKTDIQPLNAGLEFVEALNPVSFTWNMRDGGKVGEADTGFIAQDLQSAQATTGVSIPGLVYDVNPDKLEAGYGKLIPVLVQAIKDLSAKVNLLEAQLEAK